jgi:hypothetical protein
MTGSTRTCISSQPNATRNYWRLSEVSEQKELDKIIELDFRKVWMSKNLMDNMASRTEDGYKVRWTWDGPDIEGFWTPVATIDFTNKLTDLEGC